MQCVLVFAGLHASFLPCFECCTKWGFFCYYSDTHNGHFSQSKGSCNSYTKTMQPVGLWRSTETEILVSRAVVGTVHGKAWVDEAWGAVAEEFGHGCLSQDILYSVLQGSIKGIPLWMSRECYTLWSKTQLQVSKYSPLFCPRTPWNSSFDCHSRFCAS